MLIKIRVQIVAHSKMNDKPTIELKAKKLKKFFHKFSKSGEMGMYWDEQEFTSMLSAIGCLVS